MASTTMDHVVEQTQSAAPALAPYLTVSNAAQAIEFYKRAFGAKELGRLTEPGGKIGHAQLEIGGSVIMLADEYPDYGALSPQTLRGSPVKLHLYVENADAVYEKAIAAGAKSLSAVKDQFYGDRSGRVIDPFGYTWIVATLRENVSLPEMQRRFDAMMAKSPEGSSRATAAASGIREGFHTLTPYITVRDPEAVISLVKQAFGGSELFRSTGSAGGLHCEMKVGDSIVMIGGGGQWNGKPMPTAVHLFVPDVDTAYERAVQAGAKTITPPSDHPYGERGASVADSEGNHWYIATALAGRNLAEGFHTANIYLHPESGTGMEVIDFMKRAFDAEEIEVVNDDGRVRHAELRIGTSVIEMGEARGPYQSMPTMIYMYVSDSDTLYRKALAAGATSINEPADQPYGNRTGAIRDPFGNEWYIATHLAKQ